MTAGSPIVILGAGGHAREVLDILEARRIEGDHVEVLGYIVDREFAEPGTLVNDLPILGGMDWLAERGDSVRVICGVGAPELRRTLVQRAAEYGVEWGMAIHPRASMTPRVALGDGVVVAAGCVVTNSVVLGAHVHLNIGSTISHDSRIADFVTVSPGAHIAGNVEIQEGAFLGAGAVVIERRSVGAWSIAGAGAVVTADIPANSTAVGVPARVIKWREAGWHLSA